MRPPQQPHPLGEPERNTLLQDVQQQLAQIEAKIDRLLAGMEQVIETVTRIDARIDAPRSTTPPPPPTIPSPVRDFVGREADIATLAASLTRSGQAGVCGLFGIGKTQLARAVAHHPDVQAAYPDGGIEINLQGTTTTPLTAAEMLTHVLKHLLAPADLPPATDVKQLTARFHSELARRRLLLLADNARDAAQLKPLLGLPTSCGLLITSRTSFSVPGMPTMHHLDKLSPDEAEELLRSVCPAIGPHAAALAELCVYMPLALRLSASLLKIQTADRSDAAVTRIITEYSEVLRTRRLPRLRDPDAPDAPDASVQAALELSYASLPPPAQQALLHLAPVANGFSERAVEQVTGLASDEGFLPLLRRHLLEPVGDGFVLHDFVREYALARLDAQAPDPDYARRLNSLAVDYYHQAHYAAARPLFERALAIRERVLGADHPATAQSLNNLAAVHYATGDYAAARPLYERALAIRERVLGADHPATATSLNNLAVVHYATGDYAAARPLYERALAIWMQKLGPQHPDTQSAMQSLAVIRQAAGVGAEEADDADGKFQAIAAQIVAWINTPTWAASRAYLEAHPALLEPASDAVFTTLLAAAQDNDLAAKIIEQHRDLVQACRSEGIAAVYARLGGDGE